MYLNIHSKRQSCKFYRDKGQQNIFWVYGFSFQEQNRKTDDIIENAQGKVSLSSITHFISLLTSFRYIKISSLVISKVQLLNKLNLKNLQRQKVTRPEHLMSITWISVPLLYPYIWHRDKVQKYIQPNHFLTWIVICIFVYVIGIKLIQ